MKSIIKKLPILLVLILSGVCLALPSLISAETPATAADNTPAGTSKDPTGGNSGGNVVGQYKLLAGGLIGQADGSSVSSFEKYANLFFNSLLALTVLLSIMMMVYGGVRYISSEALNKKNDGKDAMINALQGLVLALVAYLILRSIDPNLVGNWNLSNSLTPTTNSQQGVSGSAN